MVIVFGGQLLFSLDMMSSMLFFFGRDLRDLLQDLPENRLFFLPSFFPVAILLKAPKNIQTLLVFQLQRMGRLSMAQKGSF